MSAALLMRATFDSDILCFSSMIIPDTLTLTAFNQNLKFLNNSISIKISTKIGTTPKLYSFARTTRLNTSTVTFENYATHAASHTSVLPLIHRNRTACRNATIILMRVWREPCSSTLNSPLSSGHLQSPPRSISRSAYLTLHYRLIPRPTSVGTALNQICLTFVPSVLTVLPVSLTHPNQSYNPAVRQADF